MNRLLLGLAALLFVTSVAHAQYEETKPVTDERLVGGFRSISADDCRKWLGYLAGPECEGRQTGHPGYQKAAEYVAAQLKSFGVAPGAADGSYFQNVPFRRAKPNAAAGRMEVANVSLRPRTDFTWNASNGEVEAPVVLVRFRRRNAELEDVSMIKGKIVIVSASNYHFSAARRQIEAAGPAAVLQVSRRRLRRMQSDWSRLEIVTDSASHLAAHVSRSAAERIATALGIDTAALDSRQIAADKVGVTIADKSKKMRVKLASEVQKIGVPNVIGMLKGSDPELAKEVVIMGAHLDHLGPSENGTRFGADDDGSGSTGLIAVAKAFTKNPRKPKRSLLFLWFCGEEMGLLGSAYYVKHPVFPVDKSVCELQMDMIGRNEEHVSRNRRTGEVDVKEPATQNTRTIHLVGSKKLSTELHEVVLDMNQHIGFRFEWDEEDVYTRSDHYNFAREGIPVAFFFTGFHRDYHQPTDTIEKINFDKITNTARLVYLIGFEAADRKERLRVDKKPRR